MINDTFNIYKYNKNKKTTYKLYENILNADNNLPPTIYITYPYHIKCKSEIKPCYSLKNIKHITSLYQFTQNDINYYFGDIKQGKNKKLIIAYLKDTKMILFEFHNENALNNKYEYLIKSKLEIDKLSIEL